MKKLTENDKKIIVLACCILVVIILTVCIIKKPGVGVSAKEISVDEVKRTLAEEKEKIIYIQNSDSKKCKKCDSIKKHLDSKGIVYSTYDVSKHNDKNFTSLLQVLSINKKDFGYPAVIYLRGGIMYSNIINISSTSTVDSFIKEYKLTEVKEAKK